MPFEGIEAQPVRKPRTAAVAMVAEAILAKVERVARVAPFERVDRAARVEPVAGPLDCNELSGLINLTPWPLQFFVAILAAAAVATVSHLSGRPHGVAG